LLHAQYIEKTIQIKVVDHNVIYIFYTKPFFEFHANYGFYQISTDQTRAGF